MRNIHKIMPVLACMILNGCSAAAKAEVKPAGSSLTILQATDLHYLSPSLTDNGTMFQKTMANGDGKMSEYSQQILDALVEKVIAEQPDVFLLSGDITFNGEKQSLLDVQTALEKIEDAGVPVCVIPGNHDIDYPYAYEYRGEEASPVTNILQADFLKTMKEFGYEEAIAKDTASFSYVYPLSKDTWLLAMDANTEANPGAIADQTMKWMEEQLQKAEAQNITVITMSHQNVLPQNPIMYQGFVMENYEAVSALLKKYHVTMNLSGHSHLEHVAQEDGLTDACTESVSLYPLQYAKVTMDTSHTFTYANEKLGILEKESQERFDTLMETKISKQLKDLYLSDAEKETMLAFAMKVNRLYFTGNTKDLSSVFEEEGWTLWKTYGTSTGWIGYLESIKEAS